MSELSKKLKEAREAAGYSQSKLAELVGVSSQSIKNYEYDQKMPRKRTLLALAKALRVSTKYLSDDTCTNPIEDIELDGFYEEAQNTIGTKGVTDLEELMNANKTFFAGGSFSEEQKDLFFQAMSEAYFNSKKLAREKFTPKKYRTET